MRSIKCHSCGASLTYNLKFQELKCEYCGTICNINTEKMEKDVFLADIKFMEANETNCPGCGAKLITDVNTISTKCTYCNSSLLDNKKVTKVFKPEKIILFEKGLDEVKNNIKRILNKNKIYVDDIMLNELKPIYLPYWLYNCVTEVEVSGSSNFRILCNGILADASTKIPDNISDKIDRNFILESLKDFDISMIAGHMAEKYDFDFDKLHNRIKEKMRCEIDKKYGCVCSYTEIENYENWYILLPFYYLDLNGMQILVNGQTGAISCNEILNKLKKQSEDNFRKRIRIFTVLLIILLAITGVLFLSYAMFENVVCLIGFIIMLLVTVIFYPLIVGIYFLFNTSNSNINLGLAPNRCVNLIKLDNK